MLNYVKIFYCSRSHLRITIISMNCIRIYNGWYKVHKGYIMDIWNPLTILLLSLSFVLSFYDPTSPTKGPFPGGSSDLLGSGLTLLRKDKTRVDNRKGSGGTGRCWDRTWVYLGFEVFLSLSSRLLTVSSSHRTDSTSLFFLVDLLSSNPCISSNSRWILINTY